VQGEVDAGGHADELRLAQAKLVDHLQHVVRRHAGNALSLGGLRAADSGTFGGDDPQAQPARRSVRARRHQARAQAAVEHQHRAALRVAIGAVGEGAAVRQAKLFRRWGEAGRHDDPLTGLGAVHMPPDLAQFAQRQHQLGAAVDADLLEHRIELVAHGEEAEPGLLGDVARRDPVADRHRQADLGGRQAEGLGQVAAQFTAAGLAVRDDRHGPARLGREAPSQLLRQALKGQGVGEQRLIVVGQM
jgi:hypothetical protein